MTVATGITLSFFFGLKAHGIALVGDVEGGLPPFALPSFSLAEQLWPAALGIALMSFVETIAVGAAFRDPDEPRTYPNKELLATNAGSPLCTIFVDLNVIYGFCFTSKVLALQPAVHQAASSTECGAATVNYSTGEIDLVAAK